MRRIWPAFVLAVPLVLCAATTAFISPGPYWEEVRYLASPELKGRATGSPELEKAAKFIAARMASFGLKPADGKNFLQSFPAELDARMGSNNNLEYRDATRRATLKSGEEFLPFSFSTNGKFEGDVVFAGYGITAKNLNYDDYAGLDVTGKLVLILRHEPQEQDEKSVFGGKKLTAYSQFTDKMVNAKMHGARGVILINDVEAHPTREDRMEKFGSIDGPRDAGIFMVQTRAFIARQWLAGEGHDLRQIEREIDKDLRPRSFPLQKVHVTLNVDLVHDTRTVHNVAAYLPGKTNEYLIIGAHYDHLGMGDSHSLAPSQVGTVHPGADDNASGTAGVIELARWFAKQPQPKRGILFLTFAGEELGLLGSNYYVNHPLLAPDKLVAMINLDMIGRIRDGRVFVSGAQTGSNLQKIMDSVELPAPLRIERSAKDSGTNMNDASDHASFVTKQIPSLFFFSGLHGDYHKPSDTADKIDADDAAKLLDYVAGVASKIAETDERPQYVKVEQPAHGSTSGSGGDVSGYGPDFGSIPDFNEPPNGVRFAGIRDGSPAGKAGLQAGDILVEFDGKAIGNLYDFTYTLRDHKPGDSVLVKVLRGSQTIEAKVLLTDRR